MRPAFPVTAVDVDPSVAQRTEGCVDRSEIIGHAVAIPGQCRVDDPADQFGNAGSLGSSAGCERASLVLGEIDVRPVHTSQHTSRAGTNSAAAASEADRLACSGDAELTIAVAPGLERAYAADLARQDNPHLGLGHGIHYCLGAALARAEVDIALRRLLTRYPALATPAAELAWQPDISRGLGRLLIHLGPLSEASEAR